MMRYDNYYQNNYYSYHHYHDYLKSPKKQIEFKAIFSPAVGGRRNEETTSNMVRRQGRIMAALGDFFITKALFIRIRNDDDQELQGRETW